MKHLRYPLALFVLVALAACNPVEVNRTVDDMMQNVDEAAQNMQDSVEEIENNFDEMEDSSSSEVSEDAEAMDTMDDDQEEVNTSVYTDFDASVLADGSPKVLFFHADWCPNCRANDARISEWAKDGEYSLPVYKLDYDSSTELKSQFGVTGQDTFVVLDAEGNVVSTTTFPSEDELRDILG